MKQAVLIMAHNDLYVLRKNIQLLNDEKIDIFIHIDKKSPIKEEDILKGLFDDEPKKSGISIFKEIRVNWGGYSQIETELFLMKKCAEYSSANGIKYGHIHLISGVDLFLKEPSDFCAFFEKYPDKEFIHFYSDTISKKIKKRYRYFHFFTESGMKRTKIYAIINNISLYLQKLLGVNRTNRVYHYQYGANWFSITMNFMKYILDKENEICKMYKWTNCCDEVFVQTIFINSPYKNNLFLNDFSNNYESIMRLIDWNRGNPYIFKHKDLQEILKTKMFFARKFSSSEDKEIIEAICNKGENEKNK